MNEEQVESTGTQEPEVATNPTDLSTTQTVRYLESEPGLKSSGRLMKMLSFATAVFIGLLFAIPVAIVFWMSLFGVEKTLADISANNAFLIQTIFLTFVGLAGGSELIQKLTKK